MFTARDTNILRHGAYNKALDDVLIQCKEYIERLEKHKDQAGNVNGADFNVFEIDAVQDIMARVEKLRIKP